MASSQDYEKLVNEVQQIKKTLNLQKLAHQATIDQLEISYNLNKQLEEVIKSQANTINSLHRQLAEKNSKLSEMTSVYQNQLLELKQFVHVKDRQLQGMRGSLMVTDYDMIRLRVVSELELVHKQEIQQLNKQIQRANKIWSDQKQAKDISIEKFNHIKKQMENQAQKYKQQSEQQQKRHVRQINKCNQRFQLERMAKKQVQKMLQSSQKKYQLLHERYQSQITRISKQGKIINYSSSQKHSYERDSKIQSIKMNLQQKQIQIDSMKKKMQKESNRFQLTIKDLEQKLKDVKHSSIQYDEYNLKLKQKDKQIEETTNSYQKKIRNIKQDCNQQIRKLSKDNQRKLQQLRQRYRLQKQNYSGEINKAKTLIKSQINSQTQKNLQQQVIRLQKQNKQLKRQLYLRTQQKNSKPPTPKFAKPRSESVQIYKNKLQQANKQIVNLLLEKASLKQKINKVAS